MGKKRKSKATDKLKTRLRVEHLDGYSNGSSDLSFGDPLIEPSVYHCSACNDDVLSQDVAWDEENQPHCPHCHGLLRRRLKSPPRYEGDV